MFNQKLWQAIADIESRLQELESCRNKMRLEHEANMSDLERLYNKLRMQLNRAEQLRAVDDNDGERSGLLDAVRSRRGI